MEYIFKLFGNVITILNQDISHYTFINSRMKDIDEIKQNSEVLKIVNNYQSITCLFLNNKIIVIFNFKNLSSSTEDIKKSKKIVISSESQESEVDKILEKYIKTILFDQNFYFIKEYTDFTTDYLIKDFTSGTKFKNEIINCFN